MKKRMKEGMKKFFNKLFNKKPKQEESPSLYMHIESDNGKIIWHDYEIDIDPDPLNIDKITFTLTKIPTKIPTETEK